MFGKSGAIAGAIVLVAVWPFAIGQIGQTMYEKQLEQDHTPYFSLENVSYQRGYLSSEIVTRISLIGEMKGSYQAKGYLTSLTVLTHVKHGFLGVSGESSIQMTPEILALTQTLWPSDNSPVMIKTDLSVFGDLQFDFTVAAIDSQQEEISLTSSPLIFSGDLKKSGETVFQLNIPLINMVNKLGETLFLKGFSSHGKGKMLENFWVGTQNVALETLGFDDAKGSKMTVNDFAIEVKNSLKDENEKDVLSLNGKALRLDNASMFSFQKLRVSNAFVLDNFKLGIHFSDIDYSALIMLLQALTDFSENASGKALSTLITALDTLVNKGLQVEIKPIEVDSPEGKINATLDFRVDPGIARATQNLNALAANLQGNIIVNIPSAYAKNVPSISKTLKNLSAYGFVSEADNSVTLSIKIKDGNGISVNGKKPPISLLEMSLM